MSAIEKYQKVLGNLSRHAPTNIDSQLGTVERSIPDDAPRRISATPPASVLWSLDPEEDVSYIGIRISAQVPAPERLVGKMAALAVEKRIVPIFISWIGNCGLQHYGMHVEQISGATHAERNDYEEQLKRMWNLAIIIDADEIAATLA